MSREYKEPEYSEEYCDVCAGSGEGMYDGSKCYACGGSGVERDYESEEDAAAERADRLNDETKYDLHD